ncbi:MAG TPA: hypothetical protein VII00_08135 [bacterium]
MKNQIFLLILTELIVLCFSNPLPAQEERSSENGIGWGGYLQTDDRMRLKGNGNFYWQEYRLDLRAEVSPAEKAHFYSEIWLRSWGLPDVENHYDLTDKTKVAPLDLDIREAYIDLYEFLSGNIDIRIGRQRIAWGTADKLNPTDNINPYDLEDIWDFGRHLGSDGLKASCYIGNYIFSVAYIPVFTPAVLPRGDWLYALMPPIGLPPGFRLGTLTNTVILPENNPKDGSTAGVKISKNFFDYDFSLSYVYGRDGLPMAKKAVISATGVPRELDIASELIYPKMQTAGVDMAGSVANVGVWAEAAVFFPEKVKTTADLSALGMGVQEFTALDNKPYIKYVAGGDYTFKNGIYLNGQYLHGFIHERGAENLEDYIMLVIDWKLLNDKLKIPLIGMGAEIKDFEDIKNNYALILLPEITYYPISNAEINLGGRWIEGKNTTAFGRVKDYDELYLKVKYSF